MSRSSRHTTLEDALASPGTRQVHDRLIALGSAPVPEIGDTWQSLSARLQERPASWSSRVSASLRRPAAALIATTLMSTGTAYAANVEPVRSSVDWLIGNIASVLRPSGSSGEGGVPTVGDEPKTSEDESDRGSEGSGEQVPRNRTVDVRSDDDAATDDRDREGPSASSTSSENNPKGQQGKREDRDESDDDDGSDDPDKNFEGDEPDDDESDHADDDERDEREDVKEGEDDDAEDDRSSKQGDSDAETDEDPNEADEDPGEHED